MAEDISLEVKKPKRAKRKALLWSLFILFSVPGYFALANMRIISAETSNVYTDIDKIPHHRVGIVLGCSPRIGKVKNVFFVGRINNAAKLYKAGKVDRILVTGDNGTRYYNEPSAMEAALIEKGIPKEHITKDFAGFRTLDSMVRAKKVFGLDDATVVTDDFHMARALYFAEGAGIKSDGFPSAAGENPMTDSTEFREVLARGRAVLDQDILHAEPKFLGKPEVIP